MLKDKSCPWSERMGPRKGGKLCKPCLCPAPPRTREELGPPASQSIQSYPAPPLMSQCQSGKVTFSFQSRSSLTPPLLPVNKYPVTEMSKQDCRSQHQLRLPKRLSSAASSCCPRMLPRCSAQCRATYPMRRAARSTSIKPWFCLWLSVWLLGT